MNVSTWFILIDYTRMRVRTRSHNTSHMGRVWWPKFRLWDQILCRPISTAHLTRCLRWGLGGCANWSPTIHLNFTQTGDATFWTLVLLVDGRVLGIVLDQDILRVK